MKAREIKEIIVDNGTDLGCKKIEEEIQELTSMRRAFVIFIFLIGALSGMVAMYFLAHK